MKPMRHCHSKIVQPIGIYLITQTCIVLFLSVCIGNLFCSCDLAPSKFLYIHTSVSIILSSYEINYRHLITLDNIESDQSYSIHIYTTRFNTLIGSL